MASTDLLVHSDDFLGRMAALGRTAGDWLQRGSRLADALDPWFSLGLFLACATLMICRLNALERKGLEGTVLGTLLMPYASGFPNLMFAVSLGRHGGSGSVIVENCIVNNVTNLTLLIGLPALIWTLAIVAKPTGRGARTLATKAQRLNTLSLMLTLVAMLFFTGILWALSRDGQIDFGDGLVLVGVFLFWQVLHVFDLLKYNLHLHRRISRSVFLDALLVVSLGAGVVAAVDRLVVDVMAMGPGSMLYDHLGVLSGCLMVLPNAVLAAWYARAGRADIVYSSQVGDGHICIPMCIGLFALFCAIEVPQNMMPGMLLILMAGMLHLFFVAVIGRLPRAMGALLTLAYGAFIFTGFAG